MQRFHLKFHISCRSSPSVCTLLLSFTLNIKHQQLPKLSFSIKPQKWLFCSEFEMSTVPKEQFLKVRCEIPHKNIHRFIQVAFGLRLTDFLHLHTCKGSDLMVCKIKKKAVCFTTRRLPKNTHIAPLVSTAEHRGRISLVGVDSIRAARANAAFL